MADRSTGTTTPAAAGGTITLGDLTVHRMGYGAMRITGKGVFGPPADRAEAVRVLRRAVELGVNFIDTADSYGPNVSEEIIAEALHPYPEGLVIATKATSCGRTSLTGNRPPACRVFGVTTNPRGRPKTTLATAVRHALIQSGNRARLYW